MDNYNDADWISKLIKVYRIPDAFKIASKAKTILSESQLKIINKTKLKNGSCKK